MQQEAGGSTLLTSVTEIVAVYLRQNQAQPEQLSQIISSVTDALRGALSQAPGAQTTPPSAATNAATQGAGEGEPRTEAPQPVAAKPIEPAVPIDESVHSNYLICLECGVRQKLLKKHLRIAHGLDPREYRQQWGLDRQYPMAAPSFAEGKRAI